MIFQDRTQAGLKLAQKLKDLGLANPLVLALPRGGVPVGRAVAKVLACGLDVIPLMKVLIPWSPEASYGVVAVDGTVALNMPLVHRLELSDRELQIATALVQQEAVRREQLYRKGKPFPGLESRDIILVDDGLASGYSMLAAVNFIKKRKPRSVIAAAPIASDSSVRMLAADKEIAAIVALANDAEPFFSLAAYYKEFKTLTDNDVLRELA